MLPTITPEQPGAPFRSVSDDRFIAAMREGGVVLLRGFGATREEFIAFTGRFATRFDTYAGGALVRRKLSRDGSVLSVTGEGHGWRVPAHGEMYYNAIRPELLWFFCESPPVSRGETYVCDARKVLELLSDRTRTLIDQRQLVYERTLARPAWTRIYQTSDLDHVKAECVRRGLALEVRQNGAIVTRYVASAIVDGAFLNNILPIEQQEEVGVGSTTIRLDDGSRIPADVLMDIEDAVDATTWLVSWQRGDLLVVDNRRFLHGRRAYSAPSKRRIAVRLSDRSFAS